MQLRQFYIYVMTNKYNRVLYIGITSDLLKRVYQHQQGSIKGFTYAYNATKLLYYEIWDTAESAIAREKQLKNWHREWKFNLIKELNPNLKDLAGDL